MSLVCFVSSLIKYVQTAIQILGQTSGLVKPAGSFTVKTQNFLSASCGHHSFWLYEVSGAEAKKKGEGKTC